MEKQGEHDLDYMSGVFDRISKNLEKEVIVYHIGGNAMCWHALKDTTKDADLVLTSESEANSLKHALSNSGFLEVEVVSLPGYEHMNQYAVFDEIVETSLNQEFAPGLRIELFLNQICGGFEFSDAMRSRSIHAKDRGLLREYYCSAEDIFLFKSITKRERDLSDMYKIYESKPDFDIVRAELKNQIKTRKHLAESVKNTLKSLGEKYDISIELL